MSNPILHEAILPFCKLTIYQDYIYVVMNEGITVEPKYNDILIDLAAEYYSQTEFVYVTHRLHSYSVDPTIYLETSKIKNLKGFVVIDSKEETANTSVEKLFFDKPFGAFKTLKEALIFKDEVLCKQNKIEF